MNKENPLVSIIVRTKDRPELLKRALQSIASQTYRPVEVVLVNDGGCDLDVQELKIILGDITLSYIRLKKNTGRAHAGNIGIENAIGKYIGFLDDDDELYPEHVETLVSFLEQSDYKIAYTDTEMVIKDFALEEKREVNVNKVVFSKDFSYKDLLVGNYIPFNSICFSKEILNSTECFDKSFGLYEDWDFLIRIGQNHPFYHINKITAIYHQWDKKLQINQADTENMKTMHLRIIDKHREKITPEIILCMKDEKERAELESKKLKDRFDAAKFVSSKKLFPLEDFKLEDFKKAIEETDTHIFWLEETIREKTNHISQLEETLNLMTDTLGWQMVESFRRFREKIFPSGTKRRMAYDLVIKSIKVLKNEGLKVFFKKVKCKIKGLTFDKMYSNPGAPDLIQPNIDRSALIHFPSKKNFNVLFLKCEWAGLTNHYRVYNMVEYLKLNGVHAEVVDLYDLPSKIPYVYKFDLILIHRVPMNSLLDSFIRVCKGLKMVVIFDLDDYLFEPSIIHLIEWVRHAHSTEKNQLIEHIRQCRQTFDACDYFICPTDFLAKKAEKSGRKAFVIRNGFSRELLHSFSKVLEEKSSLKDEKTIRIGYFSGTNTHQKDFHSIAPVILRILSEYDYVNLYICGLLELDYRFDNYLHKIEKTPFVPLEQLPYYISKIDINITPLDIGNIFCEAKSELKYFYAGILKIPTVATPTDAFKYAIRHGENGFLASNEQEWYVCLKTLLEDKSLRKTMGEKAFSHVRSTYIPEVIADRAKSVYESIIDTARVKNNISGYSISVNIIVSDVVDNFGRYSNLGEIADILSGNGHFVRLYFYETADVPLLGSSQKLSDNSKILIVQGTENILSSDILICTDPYNSSVIAYQNRNRTANLVYFKMDENYGDIPYQWFDLFKLITYSPDPNVVVAEIEHAVWDTVQS